jgi:hypothetical protein
MGYPTNHAACEGLCATCRGCQVMKGLGLTPGVVQEGGTVAMYLCFLCHQECTTDDVHMTFHDGRVLCTRCFHRESSTELRMPVKLQRLWEQALAETEAK